MKSLIIDPGHGGTDSGAVGFGTMEKDWTLKISLYQYKRLKELGAKVSLTRSKDVSLQSFNRAGRIKNTFDLCISNHWNAFNGEARGVETIHSIHAEPDFARKLAVQIAKDSDLPLRRVFSRALNKNKDYYFMHRLTGTTETIIIEYGFIDHKKDHQTYENEAVFYKVAEGVVKVLCGELGLTYSPPKEQKPMKNTPEKAAGSSLKDKRLVSVHDGRLRFYSKPSWADKDVFGYLTKGIGFPTVIRKLKVGRGEQYEVKNSKGDLYYVTAHPKYVKVN